MPRARGNRHVFQAVSGDSVRDARIAGGFNPIPTMRFGHIARMPADCALVPGSASASSAMRPGFTIEAVTISVFRLIDGSCGIGSVIFH